MWRRSKSGRILRGPKAAVTEGGKIFGVPIGSNSLALYYNTKMLSEAGVASPPKTWAELTETATKTTKSPVYGIAFSAVNDEQATWQWEPFLWSNGGSLTDLGAPKAVEALQLWVDWVKKGVASKDVVNWSQGDVPNQFIGGRAATMVMGPWQLANVKKSGSILESSLSRCRRKVKSRSSRLVVRSGVCSRATPRSNRPP